MLHPLAQLGCLWPRTSRKRLKQAPASPEGGEESAGAGGVELTTSKTHPQRMTPELLGECSQKLFGIDSRCLRARSHLPRAVTRAFHSTTTGLFPIRGLV
jgi:hypothetical protein